MLFTKLNKYIKFINSPIQLMEQFFIFNLDFDFSIILVENGKGG